MYLILCYDVKAKRVGKLRKVVKKYLHPVQRSVFEGFLPESKLRQLKQEIEKLVDCEEDSIRIYKFQTLQGAQVEQLGVLSNPQSTVI